jgi:hypothetical protein
MAAGVGSIGPTRGSVAGVAVGSGSVEGNSRKTIFLA